MSRISRKYGVFEPVSSGKVTGNRSPSKPTPYWLRENSIFQPEAPSFLSGPCVDTADDAKCRLDPLVIAYGRSDDDDIDDHDGRRSHRVINPFLFLHSDIAIEKDLAILTKTGAAIAVSAVQCDQAGVQRADENTVATRGIGDCIWIYPRCDAAVSDFGMRPAAIDLWIVAPEFFARGRIDCDHDRASRWEIKFSLNQNGVGFECKRFPMTLPELTGLDTP